MITLAEWQYVVLWIGHLTAGAFIGWGLHGIWLARQKRRNR